MLQLQTCLLQITFLKLSILSVLWVLYFVGKYCFYILLCCYKCLKKSHQLTATMRIADNKEPFHSLYYKLNMYFLW